MTGAFVIFIAMVVIGLILFLTDRKYYGHHHHNSDSSSADGSQPKNSEAQQEPSEHVSDKEQEKREPEICCGLHLVCEKTGLSPIDTEIIYYDDEELDRFIGRAPDDYTDEEREEFRDVLLTLLPEDVAGWARSISLRKIELPEDVRDELLMIVSEIRENNKV